MSAEVSKLTFSQLQYFITVVEEQGIGKAALRLNLREPSLSEQLTNLEHSLQVRLFEQRRGARLTPAGIAFLNDARLLTRQAEQAIQTARRTAAGKIGRLRIGFVGSSMYGIMPQLIRSYRERYPGVEVVLEESATADLTDALQDARIDIGFLRSPLRDEGLSYLVVQREPFFVALPATHHLVRHTVLPLIALRNEPLVIVPRKATPGFYDVIIGLCRRTGFEPEIYQEAIQMPTIVGLVAAGLGISLVPESVKLLQGQGVIYRPIDNTSALTELVLAWRRDATLPVLEAFVSLVQELVPVF